MCKVLSSVLVCAALILHVGCGHEELPTSPATSVPAISGQTIDAELAARGIVLASGWTLDPGVEISADPGSPSGQNRPNVI